MDLAAQIEMFEAHEAWLRRQCLRARSGRKQIELGRRIDQHVREYDRFIAEHGWKVVHLVKKFAPSKTR